MQSRKKVHNDREICEIDRNALSLGSTGSTQSHCMHIFDDIDSRLSKASSTFGYLGKSVWDCPGPTFEAKLKVYRAMIITPVIYASETWRVHARDAKKLNQLHLKGPHKLTNGKAKYLTLRY